MAKTLVIVESPTKAKTLRKFLGRDFLVESSVGHVRDLPASAAEIPAKYKGQPWARMGVDVENDFEPLYVVSPEKKKNIALLKKLCGEVDQLLLATDEDREGEAISWHLRALLDPKIPVHRMVFHEITKSAILDSLEHPRDIDDDLVEAQETRRIIDRLYGYEVSPVLWRKVAPRLSAGRVQSVAVRLLVEREIARMRFRSASYWDVTAAFRAADGAEFPARLACLDGKRLAGGKDFDPDTGALIPDREVLHLDERGATELCTSLAGQPFRVVGAEEKPFSRSPAAPFITSTLQQEGNRKLRFDAKRTMRAAQQLYENGFITYMRTDSVNLSEEAIRITREAVREKYGDEFLPAEPRAYRSKVKNAQEAHEAIRPAGERVVPVEDVQARLGDDCAKVYDLIWKRTLASQMKDARGRRMKLEVAPEATHARARTDGPLFTATGNVFDFHGFLRAYVEGADDPQAELANRETVLPHLAVGAPVAADSLTPESHETAPPARYTEATLVKVLEESGIGRPSTYASIIDTIQRRGYAFKKGTALVPTFTAFAVIKLMKDHFTALIDYDFTANMEDALDSISRGETASLSYLKEFYYGNGMPGLRPLLERKVEEIDPREICRIPIGTLPSGEEVVARVGRYGPFLQAGDATAPIPEASCPDEITLEVAERLLQEAARGDTPLGEHPETGEAVYMKNGRFGPFVQLGELENGSKEKPKTASLLPGQLASDVTLELALRLLQLPRTLGQDDDGVEVVAANGRYGPYIKRGSDTRSLAPEDDLLEIGLDRALELLAQEKKRRSFRPAAEPLKVFEKVEELGGMDVKLLDGRFGPYVTDGDVNASVPRGMADPKGIDLAEVVELILARRAKVGAGGGRKRGAKKTAAKSRTKGNAARKGKSKAKGKAKTKAKGKSKAKAKSKNRARSKAA